MTTGRIVGLHEDWTNALSDGMLIWNRNGMTTL